MKVIVGLGNPGSRYEKTRHNAGFWVIDYLSKAWNIPLTGKKFNAILGQGMFAGKKVILVQPQTYMNKSGESVRKIVDYWQVDLLIIKNWAFMCLTMIWDIYYGHWYLWH